MAGMTFAALARTMALAAARARTGEAAGLEEAGRLFEEDARGQVGHYQGAAGPFPAWAALKDATVADRVRRGYSGNEPLLREGDLRNSIFHEVKGRTVHVFSRHAVAPHHEFGTKKMPPRPFLGPAVVKNLDAAGDAVVRHVLTPFFARRG